MGWETIFQELTIKSLETTIIFKDTAIRLSAIIHKPIIQNITKTRMRHQSQKINITGLIIILLITAEQIIQETPLTPDFMIDFNELNNNYEYQYLVWIYIHFLIIKNASYINLKNKENFSNPKSQKKILLTYFLKFIHFTFYLYCFYSNYLNFVKFFFGRDFTFQYSLANQMGFNFTLVYSHQAIFRFHQSLNYSKALFDMLPLLQTNFNFPCWRIFFHYYQKVDSLIKIRLIQFDKNFRNFEKNFVENEVILQFKMEYAYFFEVQNFEIYVSRKIQLQNFLINHEKEDNYITY